MKTPLRCPGFSLLALILTPLALLAQPELEQWGTLRGLRVDGHLHRLDAGLETIHPDGDTAARTAHYANPSAFTRQGESQSVKVTLGSFEIRETVTQTAPAAAVLALEAEAKATGSDALAFLLELPVADFSGGIIEWVEAIGSPRPRGTGELATLSEDLRVEARGLRVRMADRLVEVLAEKPLTIELPRPRPLAEGRLPAIRARLLLAKGPVPAGTRISTKLTLRVEGAADTAKAVVTVGAERPERAFLGMGGNFRLQFKDSDPAIIERNLHELRLCHSRIALWWRDWDIGEADDELAAARAGRVTERQRAQLEMARTLHLNGLPLIVSAWDPPEWAIRPGPLAPGAYTPTINPAKFARAAESVAAYLVYLKENYGVEADLFSFNEPDLGLNPTPEEHVLMTKVFGKAFASHGLATKLLLADTSNATLKSLRLAKAVAADPEALCHVGALGFHTWGGCEDENLVAWNQAAREMKLPLLATECGSDAEAHKHPDLFLEPWFQLDQAALYVRILALAQPSALMEWQLTADYSLFKGGGAYGRQGPLEPTQRFWNYKQLARTPAGVFSLPVRYDKPALEVAVLADPARGSCTVHIVNTGARRVVELRGLPAGNQAFKAFCTDSTRGMAPHGEHPSKDGTLTIEVPATSFTSLYRE